MPLRGSSDACLLHYLLHIIIFVSFLQVGDQIKSQPIGGGDIEGHASKLPIQIKDDLAHSLGSASRSRDDVLGSPLAIMPQLPRGDLHSLLSGSDGMDCGPESLQDAILVMDDLGPEGGAGGISDNLWELSYLSWFTCITNMGTSATGAEMMTLLVPPFK
uniref:Uncharacterized protein n=1 Tax=Myotis myotis TaxID=51298 RepID=A0A7J7Z446_MYOMY|nr:hypothetical protein mMyoMyo1_010439 [Myotis myotis]